MKKTILIMFILCLPLAFALYGGETWKYHFDKCDSLEVNITAADTIDEGEYTVLNNCTRNGTNYYICECNDNYDFNISFHFGALNNYSVEFNYAYSEIAKEEQTSGGGGSSGSSGAFTIRFTDKPRTLMLKKNVISRFWINGNHHTIKVTGIFNDSIRVEIKSEPQIIDLVLNQSKIINIDNETLELTLTEIRSRVVFIKFEKVKKEIAKKTEKEINESIEPKEEQKEELQEDVAIDLPEKETSRAWIIWVIAGIVIIGLVVYRIFYIKKT